MRGNTSSAMSQAIQEVQRLFEELVGEVEKEGFHMAVGADGLCGPYIQILDLPERRGLVNEITPSNRTTIRLHTFDEHLRYLRNSYPHLEDRIAAEVHPDRPFLVIETRFRYIELGKLLLAFGRACGMNIRCIDHGKAESRLNGLRMYFDEDSFQWKAEAGAVDELLRDPRAHPRSWADDLTFRISRTAERLKVLGYRPPVPQTRRVSARDGRLAAGSNP
jgi:hypothetical protein